jgi:hypothetical protein
MKFLLSILAFLLVGCQSWQGRESIESVSLSPSVQDDPSNRLIRLSYTNDTGGRICLGPENWPSSGGIIDNNGEEFYLLVKDARYYLGKEEDYCPRCGFEVRSGGRIDGALHYASFDLPAELFDEPKVLVFTPTAWRCPNGLK